MALENKSDGLLQIKAAYYLSSMKIRGATTADISPLNILVNSAYRGEGSKQGWTTEADLLDGVRTSEETLTAMLAKPLATILLAEENDALTACVYLEKQGETMYLGMLSVQPSLQGKGIGAVLMNAAEQKAKEWQCKAIQMTVITVRTALIAYYQRKGFTDTGERQPFPTDTKFGIPKQPLEFMMMEKLIG